MNPFDFINSITHTKQNIIDQDPLAEREYVPYLTNRILSNFADTIFLANTMNTNHHLDKRMQYDYLFYSATKKKRYAKSNKPQHNNQIEIASIQKLFGYNESRARQVLSILKPEDIQKILNECAHMNGSG
jgi:hypothetical protein